MWISTCSEWVPKKSPTWIEVIYAKEIKRTLLKFGSIMNFVCNISKKTHWLNQGDQIQCGCLGLFVALPTFGRFGIGWGMGFGFFPRRTFGPLWAIFVFGSPSLLGATLILVCLALSSRTTRLSLLLLGISRWCIQAQIFRKGPAKGGWIYIHRTVAKRRGKSCNLQTWKAVGSLFIDKSWMSGL